MRGLDVDLYETSGSRLYLMCYGHHVAYTNLETLPREDVDLRHGATALTAGETRYWTFKTVPNKVPGGTTVFYNGENDLVALVTA